MLNRYVRHALITPAILLTACGYSPSEKTMSSQIAASVNTAEISVYQVNYILQRLPGIEGEHVGLAKQRVLDGLIDQELAVQQALDAKLDRSPEVRQALEIARREVLARAYLDQAIASKAKPSVTEVRRYYTAHPELFSARKLYRLEEARFAAPEPIVQQVRKMLEQGKSADDAVAFLKSKNIVATEVASTKPAEQIPLGMLPKLAETKEGKSNLFDADGQQILFTVLLAKDAPIGERQALPIIEQYLFNKGKAELTREHLKSLRAKAQIQYAGEFAMPVQAGGQSVAGEYKGVAAPAQSPKAELVKSVVPKGDVSKVVDSFK